MSDRAALLANVIDNPDDDAARLVFADWFEENGDLTRAQFIRLQCELARLDRFDSRREALEAEKKKALAAHAKRWLEQDGLGAIDPPHTGEFRRGFLEHVRFWGCAEFLELAPQFARLTPLRSAEVKLDGPVKKFRQLRLLGQMRSLHIWEDYPGSGAEATVIESTRLANLRELDLSMGHHIDEAAFALFHSPHLANLELLDLSDTSLSLEGFDMIVYSPHLANLRQLYVRGGDDVPDVGFEGVAMLARAELCRLEVLDLHSQNLGRRGLEALASWRGLAGLKTLVIDYCDIYDEPDADMAASIRALVSSPHWQDLRELNVDNTVNTLSQLEALLSSPKLASLYRLEIQPDPCIRSVELDPEQVARLLAECPYLENIRKLDLGVFDVGKRGARLLRDRFGERVRLRGRVAR
jgi:uncharacterized protein (TIGR02996 family)